MQIRNARLHSEKKRLFGSSSHSLGRHSKFGRSSRTCTRSPEIFAHREGAGSQLSPGHTYFLRWLHYCRASYSFDEQTCGYCLHISLSVQSRSERSRSDKVVSQPQPAPLCLIVDFFLFLFCDSECCCPRMSPPESDLPYILSDIEKHGHFPAACFEKRTIKFRSFQVLAFRDVHDLALVERILDERLEGILRMWVPSDSYVVEDRGELHLHVLCTRRKNLGQVLHRRLEIENGRICQKRYSRAWLNTSPIERLCLFLNVSCDLGL